MTARICSLLAGVILCASCAATRTPKGCDTGDFYDVVAAGVSSLSLVFGAAKLNSEPLLVVETKDADGIERKLTLALTEKVMPTRLAFSSSACPDLAWAAYDIEIDPADWNAFFQPGELSNFGIGFGFIEPGERVTMETIAFIVYENVSHKPILVCGCAQA